MSVARTVLPAAVISALLLGGLSACASSDSSAGSGETTAASGESPASSAPASGAGTASGSKGTGEQAGAGFVDLAGTKWELKSENIADADLAKFKITIEFSDSEASGFGGVNQYHASYSTKDDGSIEFGPIAATKMAGEPAAMAAEAAYFKALGQADHYSASDSELTLVDPVGLALVYGKAS